MDFTWLGLERLSRGERWPRRAVNFAARGGRRGRSVAARAGGDRPRGRAPRDRLRRGGRPLGAVGRGARRRGVGRGDVVMTAGRQPARVGVRDAGLLADRRRGPARAPSSCGPADLHARMEAVAPRAVVADERDLDPVAAAGFDGPVLAVPDERLFDGRAAPAVELGPERPRPDRVHLGHRRRAEADPPRPRLPGRPARAGRALVRRAAGRPLLVHRRERMVAVGAQRLRRRRGCAAPPRSSTTPASTPTSGSSCSSASA